MHTEPQPIRCFIAIDPGDAVRQQLEQCQKRLRKSGAHVRWIPPPSIHLTLAFLGDTLPPQVPELSEALATKLAGFGPFRVTAAGTGTFGPQRRPHVVWVGIAPNPALPRLHDAISSTCCEMGFNIEARKFLPHLSLGRIKSGRNLNPLRDLLETESTTEFGHIDVAEIQIYQSVLKPDGAEHMVRNHVNLA